MASNVIGTLRVNLGLDSAKFTKGMKKSQSELQKFGKRMTKIGAGISVASTGVILGVRKNLQAADEIGKMAQKIGLPVEELSRLSHAADMSGVKIGDLENSMRRLSRNMVDTPQRFEDLGIAVRDAEGNMRASEDVLDDVADLLAGMPDGAEKTALAFDLMGRSGTAMIPMLNGGAKALQAMRDEADALGIVFSKQTTDAAQEFNDNWSRLTKQFAGIGTMVTAQLAPALLKVSDLIVDMAKAFRNLSPETQKIIGIIAGVTAVLGPLVTAIGLAALAIGPLVAGVAALVSPVGLAVGAIAALAAGAIYLYKEWDTLTAKFPELQGALDGVAGPIARINEILFDMGKVALGNVISAFKAVSALLRGDFSGAIEHGKSIVEGIGRNLSGLAEIAVVAIDGLTSGMASGMINLAASAIDWAVDIVRAIVQGLAGLYDAGVQAIKDLGRGIKDQFTALKDSAGQWGKDIADGLSNGISSAKESVAQKGRDLVNWVRGGTEDEAEIKSPSRLFHRLGQFISQGLAGGIESGKGLVDGAIGSLSEGMGQIASAAQNAFASVIDGSKSVGDALMGVLDSLAQILMHQAFSALMGSFDIPGFAVGTPHAPGGLARVNERGGEIMNLPRGTQIIPHDLSKRMIDRSVKTAPVAANQTFNIEITGNIDKQTERKIYEMLPEIASGVGRVNHERGQ